MSSVRSGIEVASVGECLVLLGDEIQVVAARGAQSAFVLANSGLHDIVLGLHAFAEQALGLGRGSNQFIERAQAETAGKRGYSGPSEIDQSHRRNMSRIAIG